jgi:peptidoglycan pentaglycine glycine transferase (the first glycine)
VTTAAIVTDREAWNDRLARFHAGHLLQSWDWGEFKSRHGWSAERRTWDGPSGQPMAAAQILGRRVRIPLLGINFGVRYVPRGPCLDWSDVAAARLVLQELKRRAEDRGTLLVKIDPEAYTGPLHGEHVDASRRATSEDIEHALIETGWRRSPEQIQFSNTMVLDLRRPEEALLAGMKQKTRYNLRLAERHGVQVRPAVESDFDTLYKMYAETSLRDGFAIRERDYYVDTWGSFLRAGLAQPFLASVESDPVAGLVVYRFGPRAWFLFGMSRDVHRERMPSYLLQWEAMRWARAQGCEMYDMWGGPERLDPGDPLWGVYRFKEGFGARLVEGVGAWDYTVRPRLYWMYTALLPRLMSWMRRRGRSATRGVLD